MKRKALAVLLALLVAAALTGCLEDKGGDDGANGGKPETPFVWSDYLAADTFTNYTITEVSTAMQNDIPASTTNIIARAGNAYCFTAERHYDGDRTENVTEYLTVDGSAIFMYVYRENAAGQGAYEKEAVTESTVASVYMTYLVYTATLKAVTDNAANFDAGVSANGATVYTMTGDLKAFYKSMLPQEVDGYLPDELTIAGHVKVTAKNSAVESVSLRFEISMEGESSVSESVLTFSKVGTTTVTLPAVAA